MTLTLPPADMHNCDGKSPLIDGSIADTYLRYILNDDGCHYVVCKSASAFAGTRIANSGLGCRGGGRGDNGSLRGPLSAQLPLWRIGASAPGETVQLGSAERFQSQ